MAGLSRLDRYGQLQERNHRREFRSAIVRTRKQRKDPLWRWSRREPRWRHPHVVQSHTVHRNRIDFDSPLTSERRYEMNRCIETKATNSLATSSFYCSSRWWVLIAGAKKKIAKMIDVKQTSMTTKKVQEISQNQIKEAKKTENDGEELLGRKTHGPILLHQNDLCALHRYWCTLSNREHRTVSKERVCESFLSIQIRLTVTIEMDASSFDIPSTDAALLDYTEIDQSLNLWSEIFPMIEKEITTLTTVAQEMQDCAGLDCFFVQSNSSSLLFRTWEVCRRADENRRTDQRCRR